MLYNSEIFVTRVILATMKFSLNLVLILWQCSLIAALSKRWEPEGRIVGGHEAVPHSYPYLVSLQIRFLWVRLHLCGGSILNERWILTAGHCVKGSWLIDWLSMDAVVGTHDVNKFGLKTQIAAIDKRIPHPLYKGDIGPNDIAVLKTKTAFTFTKQVQPINLPMNYKITTESLSLAGWGALRTTPFIPAMPSKLQEVNVTYIPYEDCYDAIEIVKDEDEENPLDKTANICTGPITGGIAACNGDSGGPLVQYMRSKTKEIPNDCVEEITEENESYYMENSILTEETEADNNIVESKDQDEDKEETTPVVLGVVSWGATPCGEKGAPTVYTKVSNYIDFINQHLNT